MSDLVSDNPFIASGKDTLIEAGKSTMQVLGQIQDAFSDSAISRTLHGFFQKSTPTKIKAELGLSDVDRAISKAVGGLAKSGSVYVGIAGISGALAVAMGAYGGHVVHRREDIEEQRKDIYDRTNRYHFIHSIALMGVPLCRRPFLTGSLLTMGTLIFCGTCYYRALTNDNRLRYVTPYGGMLMILGWLSMAL